MTSHQRQACIRKPRNRIDQRSCARALRAGVISIHHSRRQPLNPMADSASPPRNPASSLGGLKGFLPLAEDAVSTRGQALSSLIQSRSSASLQDLRPHASPRRQSTFRNTDEEADGGLSKVVSAGSGARDGREARDREERRITAGEQALMTPQMRSMRLIGKSNPRYQW